MKKYLIVLLFMVMCCESQLHAMDLPLYGRPLTQRPSIETLEVEKRLKKNIQLYEHEGRQKQREAIETVSILLLDLRELLQEQQPQRSMFGLGGMPPWEREIIQTQVDLAFNKWLQEERQQKLQERQEWLAERQQQAEQEQQPHIVLEKRAVIKHQKKNYNKNKKTPIHQPRENNYKR